MKNILNIKRYQLFLLIAILFAGFACSEKIFDEQAGERITPDDHFKSIIDLEISMIGAMAPLQETMPKMIMLDGLRSDMMDVTPRADLYLKAINNQSFTLDNPYINGSDFYKVIINVNEILRHIDEVAANDRSLNDFLLHFAKGALVGLRTWSYLNIVNLYGQAAIIPDNMSSIPENAAQTFLTKEAMIDTLINQITPYIFDNNATTEYVEYSFSGYLNTKALLGELYLEKNDYANAAMYFKLAIESHGNSTALWKLDRTYTNEGWKNIFINAESAFNENISYIPFNFNESQPNPLTKWMLASDMFMVKPTSAVVDSFKTQMQLTNTIGDLARGIKVTYDTTSTGEAYISKYAIDKGEPYSSDIIISRAADLHLLLAEALNRMGDSKTALIILNAGFNAESVKPAPYFRWSSGLGVRGRAYLQPKLVPDSINGAPITPIQTTEYIEDLIIQERALELAFEGKRWFDLVRVAKRRGPEYLANKVAAKFSDSAKAQEIRTKLMNESNWYLPYKK